MPEILTSREYRAIAGYYGDRTTKRSRVPLIQHIDHGVAILTHISASERAIRAYCLHPLVQADVDLGANYPRMSELTDDIQVAVLALEYRHIANATLSTREIVSAADIPLSPLSDVNDMLIADKVQNRADFLRHHRETHPRSDALDRYFRLWLERLGIDETRYLELSGLAPPAPA